MKKIFLAAGLLGIALLVGVKYKSDQQNKEMWSSVTDSVD